jgi:DNA-binding transcriptional LysR family regulator
MLLAGLITRAAELGVEVLGRDVDQPAANATALLADADVVVVHRDARDTTQLSPRLDTTVLLREPFDVLLPPGHRLAGQHEVALRDLADESWVGVEGGLVLDDVMRSLAAVSEVQPRIVQRVNDFRVVEELVLAGVGIALMPRYAMGVRDLVRKPLSGVRAARRIEAVTRAGAVTRPAVAAVVEILVALAADVSR